MGKWHIETEEELAKLTGLCTEEQICFTIPTLLPSANPTNTQIPQGKTLGKSHTEKNSNNSSNRPVIHSRELLRGFYSKKQCRNKKKFPW